MALLDLGNKIVLKPNHSLSEEGVMKLLAVLLLAMLLVTLSFASIGAWLILPFAGLEFIAFLYAFHVIYAHADDYESICIDGENVVIEKKNSREFVAVSFNRYWANVTLRDTKSSFVIRPALFIGSHGKEVEFGRLASDEQRPMLAQQIKQKIKNIN